MRIDLKTRRLLMSAPLLLASLVCNAAAAPPSLPGALGHSRPYLQDGRPDRMTLVWRDAQPHQERVVVNEIAGPEVFRRDLAPAAQQEVVIAPLVAGRRYAYRIEPPPDGDAAGGQGTFLANRGRSARHVRFAAIADVGTGSQAQFDVAHQLAAWRPEFVLAAGDLVYPSGAAEDYRARFFTPYGDMMRSIVLYPALGNHDLLTANGAPYFTAFSVPQEPSHERYYAFDHGPARIWALDSNQSLLPGSPQYQWLAADAAASDAPWKIAFFHHSPYSSGLHGSVIAIRESLAPLFSRLAFALVISAHDHHYERSTPQNGVVYVVTGGGGGWPYPATGRAHAARVVNTFEFVGFTIHDDTMALTAIDRNGKMIDTATLKRPKAGG